jgi:hypothetical protein
MNDINSGKILNNDLNDLLKKMICIDLNNRISWEEYFKNHSLKMKIELKTLCITNDTVVSNSSFSFLYK